MRGAIGVVFAGNGRAPEGHHTIAHVFVHGATVRVNHLGQVREQVVQQHLHLGRVHVFRHLREALQVAEHHREFTRAGLHAVSAGPLDHLMHQLGRHIGAEHARQLAAFAAFHEVAEHQVDDGQAHTQHQRGGQGQHQTMARVQPGIERECRHRHRRMQQDGAQHADAAGHQDQQTAHEQQQQHFVAARVVGLERQLAVEHGREQVGMHLHPRKAARHGRGPHVLHARRGRTDQHDLALELARCQLASQHAGGRHVAKHRRARAAFAPKRHECGGLVVGVELRQHLALRVRNDQGIKRTNGGVMQQELLAANSLPEGGQGQRLIDRAFVLGQQRGRAHQPIGIGQGIEEPRRRGCLRQRLDVGAISRPRGVRAEHRLAIGLRIAREHRGRQGTNARVVPVAAEVVTQHHRTIAHGIDQLTIEIQLGGLGFNPAFKAHCRGSRIVGQAAQLTQPGAVVRFSEHHVNAHGLRLLAHHQLIEQVCHAVAAPGPMAHPGQAGLIHVHDDHTIIQRAGQGAEQAHVVDAPIQPGHGWHRQPAHGMGQQQQQGHHAQRHAQPIARSARHAISVSAEAALAIPGMHALSDPQIPVVFCSYRRRLTAPRIPA